MANKSLFEYKISPFVQAGYVLGAIFVISLICWLLNISGLTEIRSFNFWIITLSFILFYSIFSSILCLAHEDQNKYFLHAILSFVGLSIVGGLIAWMFSGLTMDEAGSFRWLYLVFTFAYIIFLTIIRSMRKIVKIAKKQDNRLRGGK